MKGFCVCFDFVLNCWSLRVHAHIYDHTVINCNLVLIGCVVLSLSARVNDIDFSSFCVEVSSRT